MEVRNCEMIEFWDLLRMVSLIDYVIITMININPKVQYHIPIFPIFQYSNISFGVKPQT